MAQWKQISLVSMRTQVQSLALLSGLRIQCCCKLWCRLQMRLSSGIVVAVAQASSCSSSSTLSLGNSIYHGCSPKKTKKKKTKKDEKNLIRLQRTPPTQFFIKLTDFQCNKSGLLIQEMKEKILFKEEILGKPSDKRGEKQGPQRNLKTLTTTAVYSCYGH